MRFRSIITILILLFLVYSQSSLSQPTTSINKKEWIKRSNEYAQILLKLSMKYAPESAARRLGIEDLHENITQYPSDRREQMLSDTRMALKQLQLALVDELDPRVQQDLRLMIDFVKRSIHGQELSQKYEMPYVNVPSLVFNGIRVLLDDQIPEIHRKAALVRLRKYVGVEPGFQPITDQAKAYTLRSTAPGQVGPFKIEVESNLARTDFSMEGIKKLFDKYKVDGYQELYVKPKQQIADYSTWTKQEILPKARTDYRLPSEIYMHRLRSTGIDIPIEQLTAMAHQAFNEYQQEMQQIAAKIAQQRGWEFTDYRDVIRKLKNDQLIGDAILPHYQQRVKDIEAIIRRERLLTLPSRRVRIRLATPAESENLPSPQLQSLPLLNNKGVQAVFVLPLKIPTDPNSAKMQQVDDFTFSSASWTLTAHETRPGHELQDSAIQDYGVSVARALYASSSVITEGWALYAEHIIKPYMPLEGQLISLQWRLLRAARAFIDPELQSGVLKPKDAMNILTDDVVFSEAFVNSEVERYTYRSPGQATAFFYGYKQHLHLRKEVEAKMGNKFDQMKYHDFILSQGLLPFDLLRKAVMEDFAAKGKG